MDDIIVIILTLIVAVFGALNQRRKKKTEEGSPVSSDKSQDQNFWNMLMDDEADVIPASQQYTNEEVKEDEPTPVMPKYNFEKENEGMHSVMQKTKAAKHTQIKKSILGEDFSLRKAVIYSEIINRKYF